jgi:hypothetical protein
MHEPLIAQKNTPYWWEAAPVRPLSRQRLAQQSTWRSSVPVTLAFEQIGSSSGQKPEHPAKS